MAKFLGLDYGRKRLGLALADEELRLALPYGQIENQNLDLVVDQLKEIIAEEEVKMIVVGLPLPLKEGQVSAKAVSTGILEEVKQFIRLLEDQLKVAVKTEDERFSSEEANRLMVGLKNKKAERDAIAAAMVLQSFLDKLKR